MEAGSLQRQEAQHLLRLVQHALDDSNDFPSHHLRLRLAQPIEPLRRVNASINLEQYTGYSDLEGSRQDASGTQQDDALLVRLHQVNPPNAPSANLLDHSDVLEIRYSSNQVRPASSSSSTLASYIATELRRLFEEEQAIISHILSSAQLSTPSNGHRTQNSQSQPIPVRDYRPRLGSNQRQELTQHLSSRMTRSLKYSPTYHITISLFSATSTPSAWQIQEAVDEYLLPILDPISRMSHFKVDTQVQIHAGFALNFQSPMFDEATSSWTLREEDLSGFVNAAEWPLSPSIGDGPTLNFVLYVPHPVTTPMLIKGNQANSWLVPQWGGIFILNDAMSPNSTFPAVELSKENIRPAFLMFSHQLLALLGAPQTPPSLPLQLRTLMRIQAASLLLSASSTMGSLARLTKALPTIAIPETVSSAVESTLTNLQRTCDALKAGDFSDALAYARTAELQAEKGFFEKSMVGQVYFPDEHKVAVYLPLLGPVGVPLFMSAVKEIKRIVNMRKAGRIAR